MKITKKHLEVYRDGPNDSLSNSESFKSNIKLLKCLWLILKLFPLQLRATQYATAQTKRYFLFVTLSTQDQKKLLQWLKTCSKRTINCNK